MTEENPGTPQWQERAVERSLGSARQRAITRGGIFIAAAVDLLRTTGKADFTVQEVVDRSGLSLRAFYQHFATKDDLLLALVEETVRLHVTAVRQRVDAEPTSRAKLVAALTTLFGSPETDDPASRGMVLFQSHLVATRTDDYAATIAPYIDTVAEILGSGVADGTFRTDLPVPVLAALVTHTLFSLVDMRILGVGQPGAEVTADDIVNWCLAGVLTRPSPTAP